MSNNFVLCLPEAVYLSLIVKRLVNYKHVDQTPHSRLENPC